jgi:phage head maturation protease
MTEGTIRNREDDSVLYRTMSGIRALEEGEEENAGGGRTFELSFSSEEPYRRWFGDEILSHAPEAVDLTRLNEIGVLLFNHDRDRVLGRIERAWIDEGKGRAIVTFDDDEAAEEIRQKVESGTLRGVSVGYKVDVYEEVEPGATSTDGRFTGPCSIAVKWMPLEVSIVSIPADATVGVGRSYEAAGPVDPAGPGERMRMRMPLALAEKQLLINRSRLEG